MLLMLLLMLTRPLVRIDHARLKMLRATGGGCARDAEGGSLDAGLEAALPILPHDRHARLRVLRAACGHGMLPGQMLPGHSELGVPRALATVHRVDVSAPPHAEQVQVDHAGLLVILATLARSARHAEARRLFASKVVAS